MAIDSVITLEPHEQKLEVTTLYEGQKVSVKASGKELYSAIAAASTARGGRGCGWGLGRRRRSFAA